MSEPRGTEAESHLRLGFAETGVFAERSQVLAGVRICDALAGIAFDPGDVARPDLGSTLDCSDGGAGNDPPWAAESVPVVLGALDSDGYSQ